MEKEIKKLTEKFFKKLGIKTESIDVLENETNIFSIKIKSDDSWILIWPHWKNLNAIQLLLRIMILKQVNEKIRIHIEINDYMESKDEKLFLFIESKIKLVEKIWRNIRLSFFWAYDRKKIHSFVSEYWNSDITTKSEWTWRERRLFICTKNPKAYSTTNSKTYKTTNSSRSKLSIDIDWEDI